MTDNIKEKLQIIAKNKGINTKGVDEKELARKVTGLLYGEELLSQDEAKAAWLLPGGLIGVDYDSQESTNETPETLENPETPKTPETPIDPETPEIPETQETPTKPTAEEVAAHKEEEVTEENKKYDLNEDGKIDEEDVELAQSSITAEP